MCWNFDLVGWMCVQKAAELKLEHVGEGPFLDVVPRCQFFKLPHTVS